MAIDFYYYPPSPPCRVVMLLAKAIGVHLNLILVNIAEGEHLKPDYIKMNPQHTIPMLNDNGFILPESRAIMGYLVNKYAKNDLLYPKNPKKKGIVDHRLYFDAEVLYDRVFAAYMPIIFGKATSVSSDDIVALEKAFELLDGFLHDTTYIVGDNLTIADYSCVTSVCQANAFGFDIGRYDDVAVWYNRCKTAMEKHGFQEINENGANILATMYRANLK